MKDNIKTIICILAIVISTVAYLRSDVETMGVLRHQYIIEDELAELKAQNIQLNDYMMVCEEVMD
jgi:hypothetical protein